MEKWCRSVRRPVLLSCFLALAGGSSKALAAESPRYAKDLKFDILYLTSGKILRGMLIKETAEAVTFQLIYVKPGEPIRIMPPGRYAAGQSDHVDRLEPLQRERLARYLAKKQAEREKFSRMLEAFELKPAPWGKASSGGLQLRSKYFVFLSNAREDIARRAAVRLEQIYAAYQDFLPPRHPAGPPTTILLVQSLAEYQAMLQKQGRKLLNPAFYEANRNEIICASDLERLGEELEQVKKEHQKLRAQLTALQRELLRKFGKVPKDQWDQIEQARRKIRERELENDKKFEAATSRLFQTLYHEAFHAYLANFVYSPAEAEVPRWLNEGLAQIFETATLDAGVLLFVRPDKNRLQRVQAALRQNELLPVADLLQAGPH